MTTAICRCAKRRSAILARNSRVLDLYSMPNMIAKGSRRDRDRRGNGHGTAVLDHFFVGRDLGLVFLAVDFFFVCRDLGLVCLAFDI